MEQGQGRPFYIGEEADTGKILRPFLYGQGNLALSGHLNNKHASAVRFAGGGNGSSHGFREYFYQT